VRYDAEIAHIDKSIELLFYFLKQYNLLKKTFVVITADHGEEFLEHDYVEHAWTLYNESLHIPLILWAPDVLMPKHFEALVSTVDLMPTLLELMVISHTRKDFDGNFLFKRKGDGFCFTQPDKPYIAEILIQHRNILRAVIKDNWKYITAIKWLQSEERGIAISNMKKIEGNEALHLDTWEPTLHEELYDLTTDPQERNNLINKKEESELRNIIEQYQVYCKQLVSKDSLNENKEYPLTQEDIEKLKALGYL
jgi:arylsulfatase A-like enzyme